MIRKMGVIILLRSGLGLGNSLGLCRPTSPGLHFFKLACICSRTEVMFTYTHSHLCQKQQQYKQHNNKQHNNSHFRSSHPSFFVCLICMAITPSSGSSSTDVGSVLRGGAVVLG